MIGRTSLRAIITFMTLVALIYLGREQWDSLGLLKDVRWTHLLAISTLFLASQLALAALWLWALRHQDVFLAFRESVHLAFLRTYMNLILPWAGGGALAVYLKRRVQLSFTAYAHLLWQLNWAGIAAACAIGAVTVQLWPSGINHQVVAGLFAAAIVSLAIGSIANALVRTRLLPQPIRSMLARRLGPGAMHVPLLPLMAICSAIVMVRAARTWFLFVAVGSPIPVADAVLFTVFAELSVAVNLTPNGLGIREAVIALTAGYLGHDPGAALAAAVLDRIVFTAWIILFGQVAIWKLNWHTENAT